MNIASVFQIIQLVIPAIQTAENFIRGSGRGSEKKDAVLSELARRIQEVKGELAEYKGGVDLKAYNWVSFALNTPEFFAKVGAVVDAIIDLSNFLQKFENEAPSEPPKPEVIN